MRGMTKKITVWLLFCLFYQRLSSSVFYDQVLDFKPFHHAIETAFITSQYIVKPLYNKLSSFNLSSSSFNTTECLIPSRGIMFTYANHYMMELIVLQHRAMKVWDLQECLESRFVTLCMDPKCFQICHQNRIKNCALLNSSEIPASDYKQNAYQYITFLKQELMAEALKVAEEVFFFDADLVLFRNPWMETTAGRSEETGDFLAGPYDIMWQHDIWRGEPHNIMLNQWYLVCAQAQGCGFSVNTGQIYMRNSTRSLAYFRNMQEIKPTLFKVNYTGVEQDFVGGAAKKAEMKSCHLPDTLFTTHCLTEFGGLKFINSSYPLSQMISHHAACVSGMNVKKQIMRRMYKAVLAEKTKLQQQQLLQPANSQPVVV